MLIKGAPELDDRYIPCKSHNWGQTSRIIINSVSESPGQEGGLSLFNSDLMGLERENKGEEEEQLEKKGSPRRRFICPPYVSEQIGQLNQLPANLIK